MQEFVNTGKKITTSDIQKVEKIINVKFPDDLAQLYLQYNGGEIAGNKFIYIDNSNDIDVSIKTFMPIIHKRTKDDILLEDSYKIFVFEKKIIPLSYIPFAVDDGGYPYCINIYNNKIYIGYLDDYDGTPESTIRFIANSLINFIDGIKTE